jgi:hypothetical protein
VVEKQAEYSVFGAMGEFPNQEMNSLEGMGGKVNVQ